MSQIPKRAGPHRGRGRDHRGPRDAPSRRRNETPAPDDRKDVVRVCGMPAVAALFRRSPERVERLFFLPALHQAALPLCRPLADSRKPYRMVEADELARVAGTVLHGGIVAVARAQPERRMDAESASSWGGTTPLLLVLDGISNPHNFGAIVRTAVFFGLDRMVISDRPGQAGPSDAAHRVAEGGLEFLELYRTHDIPTALRRLKPGYRVVGTTPDRGRSPEKLALDKPIALVFGNEETGLDLATQRACDEAISIKGLGLVQSLNVATTAAILIHDILRRRARPAR